MADAVRAGKAFVELSLRDKKFLTSLRRIQKNLSDFGERVRNLGLAMGAVGSAVVAPFAAASKVFADSGDQLDKMAIRTGFSVESLSELQYAANETGSNLEAVGLASKGMAKFLALVEAGGADETLRALGLSASDLLAMSPEDRFTALADAVGLIPDATRRASMAMQVFGRSAMDILPMIDEGAGGLARLRQRAKDLGIVMTSAEATLGTNLGDAMGVLFSQVKAVSNQIAAAVAGPLIRFLAWTENIFAAVIDWTRANRDMLASIAIAGGVLVAAGASLVGFGVAVQVAGFAVEGLVTAMGAVKIAALAMASPIGLAVSGVVAASAAFLAFAETGRQLAATMAGHFQYLLGVVKQTLSAMGTALAAGDLTAAGNVLWSSLKLLWLEGTQGLRERWDEMSGSLAKTWLTVWATIQKTVSGALDWIENRYADAVGKTTGLLIEGWRQAELYWARVSSLWNGEAAVDLVNNVNAKFDGIQQAASEAASWQNGQRAKQQNQEREAYFAQLDRQLATGLQSVDEGTRQKIEDARRALEEARSAFAGAERAAMALGENVAESISAATPALATAGAVDGPTSAGLFNVAGLASLLKGGDSLAERTAKATERTARAVEAGNQGKDVF